MNPMFVPSLLFYYGVFLIVCGIASVTLIGWKAKTALVSGGISGVIAITIGHYFRGVGCCASCWSARLPGALWSILLAFGQDFVYVVRTNPGTSSGFKRQGDRIPYHKPDGSSFHCCSFTPVVVYRDR